MIAHVEDGEEFDEAQRAAVLERANGVAQRLYARLGAALAVEDPPAGGESYADDVGLPVGRLMAAAQVAGAVCCENVCVYDVPCAAVAVLLDHLARGAEASAEAHDLACRDGSCGQSTAMREVGERLHRLAAQAQATADAEVAAGG